MRIKERGDYAHFFLITYWDTMENIKKYSGENPEIAVDYPEDDNWKKASNLEEIRELKVLIRNLKIQVNIQILDSSENVRIQGQST